MTPSKARGGRYQVVIVGGGPVGLALAVDLGLRGITCAVMERRTEPHNIPKGQNLTQRTLEHFYFWGLVDELRAARVLPTDFPRNFIVAYGDLMSEYWYKPTPREAVDQYYFQTGERLPQYRTEAVLGAKLRTLETVDHWVGWTAEDVGQDDDSAYVEVSNQDGARETLTADFLVGCDGARSLVRDTAGLPMGGRDYDQLMVLAVFRSRELHEGLKRFPPAYIYRVVDKALDGFWRFFGRVDDRETWFFHAPVPPDTDRENFDFQRLLNDAGGFEFECTFDHIGFWDMRVVVADDYRARRVFIAGDAAHSHPPYGGFGLNNGLEDAVNLGWKLAAVLDGWGGEVLLDSYGEERRAVFKETAEDFIEAGMMHDRKFFKRYNPERDAAGFKAAWAKHPATGKRRVTAYAPHYEGSTVISGPPGGVSSAHGVHSFEARPGHHLPPQILSSGRNVFEELGAGFTLIALNDDPSATAAFEAAARSRHIPLKIVRDRSEDARAAYHFRFILVRPDQYVAWVEDQVPGDAGVLMAKVAGHG